MAVLVYFFALSLHFAAFSDSNAFPVADFSLIPSKPRGFRV